MCSKNHVILVILETRSRISRESILWAFVGSLSKVGLGSFFSVFPKFNLVNVSGVLADPQSFLLRSQTLHRKPQTCHFVGSGCFCSPDDVQLRHDPICGRGQGILLPPGWVSIGDGSSPYGRSFHLRALHFLRQRAAN